MLRGSIINKNKIAIIGAGLAGLTAAYRLMEAGFKSDIYEMSNRVGGRVFSAKFSNGQIYEKGGEFIDKLHLNIINLVRELNLDLVDVLSKESNGSLPIYRVLDYDTNPPTATDYRYEDTLTDLKSIWPIIDADIKSVGYPVTYNKSTPRARELDQITLEEYINKITSSLRQDGNGSKTKLAQLLKIVYTIEFGAEPNIQSPLTFLFLVQFCQPDQFNIFSPSNEKYKIIGGNSLIAEKLEERLKNGGIDINRYHQIVKIARLNFLPNKPYELIIRNRETNNLIIAGPYERIVIAVPFSVLRPNPKFPNQHIDITEADFSPLKLYAIANLQMSSNVKLNIQFKNRFWKTDNTNGDTIYSKKNLNDKELAYQSTWDVSRGQDGEKGILVNYMGGEYAKNYKSDSTITNTFMRNIYIKNVINDFITKLNETIPLAQNNFEYEHSDKYDICNVSITNWDDEPGQRGSYSYWQLGQYAGGTGTLINAYPFPRSYPAGSNIAFAGVESEPEPRDEAAFHLKNCHFAGEHTSYEFQGYINGAVQSGERVANEIIAAFKYIL